MIEYLHEMLPGLVTCLKIFPGSLIPYSKHAGKIISFYIKIFGIILRNI